MLDFLKLKYRHFLFTFGWSDWVNFIDGWIPKFALFVPIIGYIILFNDTVTDALIFKNITDDKHIDWGLSVKDRLRFLYFGLIFLGLSNFIYRLKKPYQFRFGTNMVDYTRTCLEILTLTDYMDIHSKIRSNGHYTLTGKYYDSEWDGFLTLARNEGEGTNRVVRNGNWELAKSQYGSLLRGMLRENFFRYNVSRRKWLSLCVFLSSCGYLFLIIPSFDIFIKVLLSMTDF